MMHFVLLALATVAPSVSATASDSFWTDGDWSVHENDDNCALIRLYEGSTTLYVSYQKRVQKTWVMISDPAFKSVERGKKYKLNLVFRKQGRLDEGWGSVDADGATPGDDKGFAFALKGSEALADLAASDTIALFRSDDILVSALKLDGSANAVAALKRCATKVDARNPADPLEGFEEAKP